MRSLRTANSLTSRNISSAPPGAHAHALPLFRGVTAKSRKPRTSARTPVFCAHLVTWEVPIDIAVGCLSLKVGAMGCQGAAFTLRLGALANLLAVLFKQQVSALPRCERLGQSRVQDPSRRPVIGGIVL